MYPPTTATLLLLLLLLSTHAVCAIVQVSLKAPWPSCQSPYLEYLEAMWAASHHHDFWTAVTNGNITQHNVILDTLVEEHVFAPALEAQRTLSDSLATTLEFDINACPDSAWVAIGLADSSYATCMVKDLADTVFQRRSECSLLPLAVMMGHDRIHPESSSSTTATTTAPASSHLTLILHGAPDTAAFKALFQACLSIVRTPNRQVTLVIRLVHPRTCPGRTTEALVGGFYVQLDVKNTEYIAVNQDTRRTSSNSDNKDFVSGVVFSRLATRPDIAGKDLSQIRNTLETRQNKLKAWEIQDLSMQAALDVTARHESELVHDPLARLEKISHNLPTHARRLSIKQVDVGVMAFVKEAAELVHVYTNKLWIGGELITQVPSFVPLLWIVERHLAMKSQLATLVRTITDVELANRITEKVRQLTSEGTFPPQPQQQQQRTKATTTTQQTPKFGLRIDVRKRARGAVLFINDVEKDDRYAGMSRSLKKLKMPAMNQLHAIARNVYTLIFVMDPTTPVAIDAMNFARYVVQVGAPIKVGFVFTTPALSKLFASWSDDDAQDSSTTQMEKNLQVSSCRKGEGKEEAELSGECDALCFITLFVEARRQWGMDAALASAQHMYEAMEMNVAARGALSCAMAIETFATGIAEVKGSWSNREYKLVAEDLLRQSSPHKDTTQTMARMARYSGSLTLPIPSFSLNGLVTAMQGNDRIDTMISRLLFKEQSLLGMHVDMLNDEEDVLVQILREAKARQHYSKYAEVKYDSRYIDPAVHVKDWQIPYLGTGSSTMWAPFFDDKDCVHVQSVLSTISPNGMQIAAFPVTSDATVAFQACIAKIPNFVGKVPPPPPRTIRDALLTIASSTRFFLIVNSRIIPINGDDELFPRDVETLMELEHDTLEQVVFGNELFPRLDANMIWSVCSTIGHFFTQKNKHNGMRVVSTIPPPDETIRAQWHSLLKYSVGGQENDQDVLEMVLIANPLDLWTQRAVSSVRELYTMLSSRAVPVRVNLLLAPKLDVGELPPSVFFAAPRRGIATFHTGPGEVALNQLLTMKISTPSSWLAYPGDLGELDPDNLILDGSNIHVHYEVAHVLVEGHVTLMSTHMPAAGMQIELLNHDGVVRDSGGGGTSTARGVKSTIVMHNLGYWQIKASPGFWHVVPRQGTPFRFAGNERVVVALNKFENLPSELEAVALTPATTTSSPTSEVADDTIHVFSLASGALYERFLRIMMLSVRKRTSGHVKFWLLENYMSARMKRFVGVFAAKYKFEVELVTFAWPEWLRGQSERQRQIWGMKILFLDVLFPLDVKKIIYVDSDQVLRADLRELWKLDLKGAPYGMTPFCDSRKETLGFQFWRSGYWKNHLQGKNYHISALFVVDLVVFRRDAVGDKLRGQYHQLSADPNSLSNLDQDLPNFAQHEIPIFSLPISWLWCESWCSDASKATAKTIDLCNNPLHKEPKLDMAKRVIKGELFPESWEELDEEVNGVWRVVV